MFIENEPITLICPAGNYRQQKWRWESSGHDIGANVVDEVLIYKNGTLRVLHLNETKITDEGIYQCREGRAVLLVVQLYIMGM